MKALENVNCFLFDFGNVIINIDFQLTHNKFREYLEQNYDTVMYALKQNNFHEKIETGNYTAEKMASLINEYDCQISADEVKTAWNALLLDIPIARLELLAELRKTYPIYLLSNTNFVHIEEIFSNLKEQYGKNPMYELFDKLYLSYEIGYIKPQPEIYEYVIEDTGMDATKCLFFDDLQENLDAAERFGFQTQLVTPHYGILEFFQWSSYNKDARKLYTSKNKLFA